MEMKQSNIPAGICEAKRPLVRRRHRRDGNKIMDHR
jgi:hypothetical protein